MEDKDKAPDISEESSEVEVPETKPILRGKKKPGRPPNVFERPPFANEIFSEEKKKVFDNLPGKYRHFVKTLIETGSPIAAAKLSGIKSLEKVDTETEDKQESVTTLLRQHGLGPDQLVTYLQDCVKAEVLIRDKHGGVHQTIDIKTRMQSIAFLFRLMGYFDQNKSPKKSNNALDLFNGVDPESEE